MASPGTGTVQCIHRMPTGTTSRKVQSSDGGEAEPARARQHELGQFLTPDPAAHLMASRFPWANGGGLAQGWLRLDPPAGHVSRHPVRRSAGWRRFVRLRPQGTTPDRSPLGTQGRAKGKSTRSRGLLQVHGDTEPEVDAPDVRGHPEAVRGTAVLRRVVATAAAQDTERAKSRSSGVGLIRIRVRLHIPA